MSCRTIVYKGLFMAPQLFAYYPDLADERMVSALAVVHQRYSTNTFPNWRLAQPFRMVAHNGEINTLAGNRNRMVGRERHMSSPLFGEHIEDLRPVIQPGGSDSAAFDNVVELLVRGGRSLPHSMMMMIPEAFGTSYHISTDKRAFYEYHAAIMEPWDGPAAMVFTDGRIVGGTLDRNGLRPCRYTVTTDGLVVLASEVGVIDFPPEQVQSKGRLQPGKMFLVDTEEGRIIGDNEIKAKIARQKPYRRWLQENRIELRGLFSGPRPVPSDPETIARRMRAFGYTREELQLIIGPMAQNGQEAVGSMGTDTPLAVLSDKPKLLFNYFKQLFAQVTNPPMDPLREGLVMSLMTFTGREKNLLDETPEHCRQLKLPHPILTNEDIERLRATKREDFKVATIYTVFDAGVAAEGQGRARLQTAQAWHPATDTARKPSLRMMRAASLKQALDNLVAAAEQAVLDGAAADPVGPGDLADARQPSRACWRSGRCTMACLRKGLRSETGIIVESGEPREVMHFALLVGYGAKGINPYLACEVVHEMQRNGELPQGDGGRAPRRELHHSHQEGPAQDHEQDGHLDAAELPQRPAVRGGGAVARGGRRLLPRDQQPDRRGGAGRDRQGGAGPAPQRVRRAAGGVAAAGLRRRVPPPPRRRGPPLAAADGGVPAERGAVQRPGRVQGIRPADQRAVGEAVHAARADRFRARANRCRSTRSSRPARSSSGS